MVADALSEALRHFVALDNANAAIHCSPVRFSPITFRLAEALASLGHQSNDVDLVMEHAGTYEEDRGR